LRILFIGDVVGKSGRTAIAEHLPGLIRDWKLDCTIVNGENAAGGLVSPRRSTTISSTPAPTP
jgi:calcineurin-like phosphoesterase